MGQGKIKQKKLVQVRAELIEVSTWDEHTSKHVEGIVIWNVTKGKISACDNIEVS